MLYYIDAYKGININKNIECKNANVNINKISSSK